MGPNKDAARFETLSRPDQLHMLAVLSHGLTINMRGAFYDQLEQRRLTPIKKMQHMVANALMMLTSDEAERFSAELLFVVLAERAEMARLQISLAWSLDRAWSVVPQARAV